MQKSEKRLNSKHVGVDAHIDPLKQNGITLIALIITIIVMMILVGVTVATAINGGLFETARKAAKDTQIEADKEELQAAVAGAYDAVEGTVDGTKLRTNLPGWTVEGEGPFICTSTKGNTFKVNLNGIIEEGDAGENPGGDGPTEFTWGSVGLKVDTTTEYQCEELGAVTIFSEDGKLEIVDINKNEKIGEIDATIEENIVEGIINCSATIAGNTTNTKVTMNEEDENDENIYVELQGMGKFTFVKAEYDNINVYSNEEVLKRLGVTNYEGTYKGTWTVIGEENGKTKLVSTRNVSYYRLGYDDPRAIKAIPAVNESEPTDAEKLDRAIWSYKNVEATLNEEVAEATKGMEKKTDVRSINIEDIEALATIAKGTDYEKEIIYNYENAKDQIFVDENGNTVKLDSPGKQIALKNTYFSGTIKKDEIAALANGHYWLTLPCVSCGSGDADFRARFVADGEIISYPLFDSDGKTDHNSSGIRAVVSI